MSYHISLVTITLDKLLLAKIREFLLNQLDEHSKILGTESKLINILDKKPIPRTSASAVRSGGGV